MTIPSRYFVVQIKLLPKDGLALCESAPRNNNARNSPPR